jgi:hypothetical protein
VLVEGQAASLVDTKASLKADMPLALALIFGTTFVLLFLFTGSLLIPVKALVLNVLSLCATFGAMVWVFQQGNLVGLIGDPVVTGTLDTTVPILMFCLLFGLSMDYEVFLLSRIKEVWDATGDNTRAVAVGPAAHRPDRHRGRRAARDRVPLLRQQRHQLHQAARPRDGAGDRGRRDADPRRARPGVHAPRRHGQLVGTRPLRACTTASASARPSR